MDNTEEEPEPRIGFIQVPKRPTAADQFAEYHNEYEARASSSVDRIRQVEEHNKTYPQISKELDKRRSTAQVNCHHKKHREPRGDQRCSTSKKTDRKPNLRKKVNMRGARKMRDARKKRGANGVRKNKKKNSQARSNMAGKRRGCICAAALEKKIRGGRLKFSNKESLRQMIGDTCCACKQVFRRAIVCDDDDSDRNKKDLRDIYHRSSRASGRNSVDSQYSYKSKSLAIPGSNRSSVTTYRSDGSMSREPMV